MDNLRLDEMSAMAATNTDPPAIRRRQIGPVGTTGRILVGALLLVLGRDDQIGCAVFWPIDQLEHQRTARRA
jgi:hypothetical protein